MSNHIILIFKSSMQMQDIISIDIMEITTVRSICFGISALICIWEKVFA